MLNPEKMLEKSRQEYKKHKDYIDIGKMAALEDELNQLKKENNMVEKRNVLFSIIDKLVDNSNKKRIQKSMYIRLALSIGWFSGAHRFYAGQKIRALLYLLFFWTGIPFTMTLIDLMVALPMQSDEDGYIYL